MRIDASRLYPQQHDRVVPRGDTSGEDVRVPDAGNDHVRLSSRGQLVALARQALEEAPAVRRPVVEAARKRIATVKVGDGRQIAEAIIATINEHRS